MRTCLALLVALGCGGSITPSPSARALRAPDESCDVPGFTADALLAKFPRPTQVTFTYAAGGSTPLALDVVYAGGKMTCVPDAGDPDFPAAIDVEVSVTFYTKDKVFLESALIGKLHAQLTHRALDTMTGTLTASEPIQAIMGSYKPSPTARTLGLGGQFASGAPNGSVIEGGEDWVRLGTWQ